MELKDEDQTKEDSQIFHEQITALLVMLECLFINTSLGPNSICHKISAQ